MLYTATRRLEEKSRRRACIIDAAEQLYAECGWDMLTVDEVARRARLSRALLYVYFRDKNDLHLAIVERALLLLYQRFRAAEASQALGLDKVLAMGRAFATLARERPHYFDACSRFQILRTLDAPRGETEAACQRAGSCILQCLGSAIAVGYADRSIRHDLGDDQFVVLTLWAFMHGSLQIAHTKASGLGVWHVSEERLFEQTVALLRHMLQSSSTMSSVFG